MDMGVSGGGRSSVWEKEMLYVSFWGRGVEVDLESG